MQEDEPNRMKGVTHWFCGFPGSLVLEQEHRCIDALLSKLFGYYLLQIGSIGGRVEPEQGDHIRSRILVTPEPMGSCLGRIRGSPGRLPIASDSIDVVLLVHTLDFYPSPHQTLREADRVLIPEGRLVIVGFNPWSFCGLWRLVRWNSSKPPWNGRFIAQHRLYDWLSLLGFEVETTWSVMFRPPFQHRSLMDRLQFMERLGRRWWPALSGVYVIQAVKRVSTLTPLKPTWRFKRSVLTGRAIEPSTRNSRG
ncbi:MAG: class I SAM-dependent methyltransferase [Gammaproteobacteria bacterium]|nr:class I SAM-dependent methyltransferase [Gammaproteobacteria bacterium]